MTASCVSIILPVYNEDGNIAACLRGLTRAMQGLDHEILVCYDIDEDTTLPAIAAMDDRPATVKTGAPFKGSLFFSIDRILEADSSHSF